MVTNLSSSFVAFAQLSQFSSDRETRLRSNAADAVGSPLKTGQMIAPLTADRPRYRFLTTLLRALSAVAA